MSGSSTRLARYGHGHVGPLLLHALTKRLLAEEDASHLGYSDTVLPAQSAKGCMNISNRSGQIPSSIHTILEAPASMPCHAYSSFFSLSRRQKCRDVEMQNADNLPTALLSLFHLVQHCTDFKIWTSVGRRRPLLYQPSPNIKSHQKSFPLLSTSLANNRLQTMLEPH